MNIEKTFHLSWLSHASQRVLPTVILLIMCGVSLYGQDIRIKVLNGRNGHPVTNERVNVWIGDKPAAVGFGGAGGATFLLPTNKNGVAVLHLAGVRANRVEIETNYYVDCRPFQKNASQPTYSVKDVLESGYVTENTCGKVEATPRPGELIFFVRPLHWWEAIRR